MHCACYFALSQQPSITTERARLSKFTFSPSEKKNHARRSCTRLRLCVLIYILGRSGFEKCQHTQTFHFIQAKQWQLCHRSSDSTRGRAGDALGPNGRWHADVGAHACDVCGMLRLQLRNVNVINVGAALTRWTHACRYSNVNSCLWCGAECLVNGWFTTECRFIFMYTPVTHSWSTCQF